jgi:large subunit ribosomal protein L31
MAARRSMAGACGILTMAKAATEHPDYHFIKVVMTDGTEYTTRSTWGKEGDTLHLEIDSRTHPAWTGGQQQLLDRGGRLSRFNSRFGGMSFAKK